MSIIQGEKNQEVRGLLEISWRFLCLMKQLKFSILCARRTTFAETFLITMTPSCVVWSVTMLNMSWPPTMLYSISALRPMSGSSALIRPMAPPTSTDSRDVTRKESKHRGGRVGCRHFNANMFGWNDGLAGPETATITHGWQSVADCRWRQRG